MYGIAHRLFKKRYGLLPWKDDKVVAWPVLESLLEAEAPLSLELAFAKHYLTYSSHTESSAAFLCYLMLAARQGHLCVCVDGSMRPRPNELCAQVFADKLQLDPVLIERFAQLICQGSKEEFKGPLIKEGSLVYLKRFWTDEQCIKDQFQRLLQSPPSLILEEMLHFPNLRLAQAEAINAVRNQSVTLITGGPGTGKTYTAKQIVAALAYASECPLQVSLAAPTGKAAANLAKAVDGIGNIVSKGSKTLHSLLSLGKQRGSDWSTTVLGDDLIIIDECSMVDVHMMGRLLHAVKAGSRLVMLGDPDQLPSVQAGGVFADLVAALQDTSHVVRLTESMRTESKQILEAANSVRMGDLERFKANLHGDLILNDWPSEASQLRSTLLERMQGLMHLTNPSEALQIRLLTPLREGPWGVEQLNRFFLENAWNTPGALPKIIPIMISVNAPKQGLFNGDTGVLVSFGSHGTDRDYALFERLKEPIPAISLPSFEYAYCLSVHKSQGSEYDQVLLILPPRSEAFGRELLYTAITRARRNVELWASDQTLEQLISRRMERLSGLYSIRQ